MSSVPSQGFSCNRNNKLNRSMMSNDAETQDNTAFAYTYQYINILPEEA